MVTIYAVLMLDLLFRFGFILYSEPQAGQNYNLIPFRTIWTYLSPKIPYMEAVRNLLGNIAAFIPFGLYLQALRGKKRIGTSFLIVLVTSALVEILQFFFNVGTFDIDDVLLNGIGGLLGILLYHFLRKVTKDEDKTKTVITVLSLLFGIPCLSILLSGRF